MDILLFASSQSTDPEQQQQQQQPRRVTAASFAGTSLLPSSLSTRIMQQRPINNAQVSRDLILSHFPNSLQYVLLYYPKALLDHDRVPDLSSIPRQFICPISMEMMVDPVITTAGLTYERAYIEEWFRTGHTTDPMAHVPVADLLTTNIALKQQIEAFVAHSAVLQQHQQSEEDSKLAMQLRIDELTEQLNRIQMQQRQNDHIIATPSIAQTQVKIAHPHIAYQFVVPF